MAAIQYHYLLSKTAGDCLQLQLMPLCESQCALCSVAGSSSCNESSGYLFLRYFLPLLPVTEATIMHDVNLYWIQLQPSSQRTAFHLVQEEIQSTNIKVEYSVVK